MDTIDQLANKIAPHYSHFDVENRLLFTGHSHQAWPDVALEGLKESFTTAASRVDNKWEPAFEKTEILRNYLRNYYDDPNGLYSLAENTHLLLVAWLSSFDLRNKPKVITTTGEFHSMFRQLHRLKEEGLEVVSVDPYDGIVSNITKQIDDNVSAIMLSRVYFGSGLVNQHIPEIAALARSQGIPLLIDDYHGTNVVPLSISEENLEDCYLLVGGYKYLQWGEGNCFLRFPKDCKLRPAITGWFASFSTLDKPRTDELVSYDDGNQRFASGTYDPASQFRAAKVVAFFEEQGLTSNLLRQQYQRQVGLLRSLFLEQDFDPDIIKLRHNRPLEENGGFLALRSPFARTIRAKLMERDVFTDARGDIIRFGPAPYTTSTQIEQAITELSSVVNNLNP
ncbi:aminotransferase class V-fold PLP-dependent enzyme [Fodinibius halophilus]|uniref:Aminotransferase class V-fold PLP-dependent enzyme n=1 Tax=Fodinibius halophilus TaxID=1736908 RepID=A0A6M1T1D6_9BACT|nr:aminotransferase class V-fold PLP-dependent enzyme [Fodinibius halophilus]NGP89306.1 aminotransferase class V-fold PLP-dependent enzyme [Fodinibius halophilus]